MPTPVGEFHVKFVGVGGEARHGPLNEVLGNRLLEALGCDRPATAIVRVPQTLRDSDAELGSVASEYGFGIGRIDGATDLAGPAIGQAADRAPEPELFATFVVLTWLQNTDHDSQNYLQVGDRVVAIDFAASPNDGVWAGADLTEERRDHALRDRIDRIAQDIRSPIIKQLETIDAAVVVDWLDDVPDSWATHSERKHIAAQLERTKEALVADFR